MDALSGVAFGLIAMAGFGLSGAMSKAPIEAIGGKKTVFLRGAMLVAMLACAMLVLPFQPGFQLSSIALAFLIAIIGYIPLAAFYAALKKGHVGVVSPVANSSVVFTVMLSIIFFNEALSGAQLISILLIILGIALISLDFKDLKNSNLLDISSGIPYALLASILWGFVYFIMKVPVSAIGPVLTALIIEFGVMLTAFAHMKVSKESVAMPDRKVLRDVFLVALFAAIASISFNYGILVSDVSTVAAIAFANPLISTMYGKFAYGEKLQMRQYLAALLMVGGIIALSYF